MNKNLVWRGLVLAFVILGGLAYLLPTILSRGTPDGKVPGIAGKILPAKVINLGLDLKGGIYLAMEIDLQVAVNNAARRATDDLRQELNEAGVSGFRLQNENSPEIVVEVDDPASLDRVARLADSELPVLRVASRAASRLVLGLTSDYEAEIRDLTARQALETIRNRVDMFGVAEPDIRPQGEDRIIIQLPGVNDPVEAVELIGKTAILEFKLVDNGAISAEQALRDGPPPGTEVLYERDVDPMTGVETRTPILLRKQAMMTGESLIDARAVRDQQFGLPQVTMSFNSRGAREFSEITERYVGRNLAIVLDNQVFSAPVIRTKIPDGNAVIESSSFTPESARLLAVVLRAGALPAPVTVIEERTVGPSMGSDSISQGLTAGTVGLVLILLFMLIYYSWSGVVADLALLFNFPIILGALAAMGATLTLPGIFGLVLTLAMAVDANVLIFERIREEIRRGKGPLGAISGGFDHAFWTIFDANLTTVLAAMVLYQFGSGPIRGFAVTLIIGIISSMFTAIFCSRWVFDLVLSRNPRIRRISI
ncbi:MAG: protein translocase subunit SecD [Deltaproteobacteria bacterium]|jgi:preprotein translocase subunit SecD|nr:protein translocase subunit SecD [Deltaproteobacteria bacterium]